MAHKKKRYTLRNLPPCPDPANMHLAEDADGFFWKYNRGVLTELKLNDTVERNKNLTGPTNKAGVNILSRLHPFLQGIRRQGLNGRVAGAIKRGINRHGVANYAELAGFEWQQEHAFGGLVQAPVAVTLENGQAKVGFELWPATVRRFNTLVTHYYFDAVLLYGDPMLADELKTEHSESALYSFDAEGKTDVELVLELPTDGVPWMLMLKVSCLEGPELAMHPKFYRMKVLRVR
ncbi:MAG: hypothetical protein ACO1OO_07215 [Flavisolibacter sp.]